jgi:6-phosphogluconate dehydrogenase (decarboxylating)
LRARGAALWPRAFLTGLLARTALFDRFESRGHAEFANKVLSAQRALFGGHQERR